MSIFIYYIQFKMNDKIKKLVVAEFGDSDILSGDEIKEKLARVFSENGIRWYPTIKVLETFGYSLERKKDGNHFMYHIHLKWLKSS